MAQKHHANVDRLPSNAAADSARRYIEHGTDPCGFVYHVLINDFATAAMKADGTNKRYIRRWAEWLRFDIPAKAWGDEESVREWSENGGMNGGA